VTTRAAATTETATGGEPKNQARIPELKGLGNRLNRLIKGISQRSKTCVPGATRDPDLGKTAADRRWTGGPTEKPHFLFREWG
jgi:hypothetical protein